MTRKQLEQAVERARKAAWDADTEAREAKERARALAEERVRLEQELDLELWVDAQLELGIPEEDIDRENRAIRNLPPGPTIDDTPGA